MNLLKLSVLTWVTRSKRPPYSVCLAGDRGHDGEERGGFHLRHVACNVQRASHFPSQGSRDSMPTFPISEVPTDCSLQTVSE